MDWSSLVAFTIVFHVLVYAFRRELTLRFDTRKFNGYLNGLREKKARKYFKLWFRLGTYATLSLGFPFTMWLFTRTIYYSISPTVRVVVEAVTSSTTDVKDKPIALAENHGVFSEANLIVENENSMGDNSYIAVQPIIPGWNLPLSHLPYYLAAILISVLIHELGHAVAAASHKVSIVSVGFSLFGPFIPTAHVEISSSQLKDVKIQKQLDILTAGVWMNIYLSLVTYIFVPKIFPALMWPTHSTGVGISVTNVSPYSGAGGPSGFVQGDIITAVEKCPVNDSFMWERCLEDIWKIDPVGYCISTETIVKFSNNSEGCCDFKKDNSPTHLCYADISKAHDTFHNTPAEDPERQHQNNERDMVDVKESNLPVLSDLQSDSNVEGQIYSKKEAKGVNSTHCLPAKFVATSSFPMAVLKNYNMSANILLGDGRCYPPMYSCQNDEVEAVIGQTHSVNNAENANGTPADRSSSDCYLARVVQELDKFRIVQIFRRQQQEKEPVLFVGNVYDLYDGISVSDYTPRNWFLSHIIGYSNFCIFPRELEEILLLTAGLSAGLAVVNILPIYGLDGYHAVNCIVHHFFGKKWDAMKISRLVNSISCIAISVALITVLCSLIIYI